VDFPEEDQLSELRESNPSDWLGKSDGVDIRIIQLMLGHASIQQTRRHWDVADEIMRRGLEVSCGICRREVDAAGVERAAHKTAHATMTNVVRNGCGGGI
jgi:hypothetical protein